MTDGTLGTWLVLASSTRLSEDRMVLRESIRRMWLRWLRRLQTVEGSDALRATPK